MTAEDLATLRGCLPVLKGAARTLDLAEFTEFCRGYLPAEFNRRMSPDLREMWLTFHGEPNE
jgi:hypothetical protein